MKTKIAVPLTTDDLIFLVKQMSDLADQAVQSGQIEYVSRYQRLENKFASALDDLYNS
jgi:hypothetical protein